MPSTQTLTLLTLLLTLTNAFDRWSSSVNDACEALPNIQFNATGSVSSSSPDQFTLRTGFRSAGQDDSAQGQYFWLDTQEPLNLNARNRTKKMCMHLFFGLDASVFNNTPTGTGDCSADIGDSCMNALMNILPAMEKDDECTAPSFASLDWPTECKEGSSNFNSVGFQYGPSNQASNRTCGSTVDNENGAKSYFASVTLSNSEAKGFASYDLAAKQGYLVLAVRFDGETTQKDVMCVRNAKVEDGSRDAFEEQKPSPNGSATVQPTSSPTATGPAEGAAAMSRLGWMVVAMSAIFVVLV